MSSKSMAKHISNTGDLLQNRNVEGKQMLVPYRGSIADTLTEMEEDLQSSISYAGGKDLSSIKLVDYVIVKNTIMSGDK